MHLSKNILKWNFGSVVLVFFVIGWLSGMQPVMAESVWDWPEHAKILPGYCKHRMREGVKGRFLYPQLAPIWKHIHHYCAALYGLFKAQVTIDPAVKRQWLSGADDNFKYMGKRCRLPECIIYPELYTYWGMAVRERGDIKKAVSYFEKAIHAKPDYAKAYAELADLFLDLDQKDKAAEILKRGLKNNPSSRRLKRMLRKLTQVP